MRVQMKKLGTDCSTVDSVRVTGTGDLDLHTVSPRG